MMVTSLDPIFAAPRFVGAVVATLTSPRGAHAAARERRA
jgi:hypothetical protein